MSKKVLLRRPRCVINDVIVQEKSADKIYTRHSSFKDDIRPEIEELDRQHEESLRMDSNVSTELVTYEAKDSHIETKLKTRNEFSVVSLCNIDEGLLPMKFNTPIKKRESCKKAQLSKKTFKEFEKLENVSSLEKNVFNQNIFEQIEKELPNLNKSIPKHIIVIQLAALLKCQLSDDTDKKVSCKIKHLSKIEKFPSSTAPKYEIILYENDDIPDLKSITPYKISDILQRNLMNTQKSLNEVDGPDDISPTMVSMMECFMTGKQNLNFSAHSISKLPNIADVFQNLSELNLSYNDFRLIPEEIFQLQHLDYLNIKNNPLQILDDSILKLPSLRVLICSFTLISNIPSSLFRCENLEQVDLSYNDICFVPHVNNVYKLKVLNLSGNPIKYFKKSFTKLNLENLGLENTLIHPVFWKQGEYFLSDYENSWAFCDLCDQIIVDFSINSIAFSRKFNHVLPILLSFCSSLCRESMF